MTFLLGDQYGRAGEESREGEGEGGGEEREEGEEEEEEHRPHASQQATYRPTWRSGHQHVIT
jgi:hypothetical protein